MVGMNWVPRGIDIGIIGPAFLVTKLEQVLKQFPTLVPQFGACANVQELVSLTAEISAFTEVLLFTDPYSYYVGRKHANKQVPVHFVPLTGTALYRALYKMRQRSISFSLSVDSVSRSFMEKVVRELDERAICFDFYPKMAELNPDDVLQFHRRQYEDGQCTAVLTGIGSVAEQLEDIGIPNELLSPTEQDMVVSLERTLLATESRRNKESQIVVGIISIDHLRTTTRINSSEHDIQRMHLDIHGILLEYVESWKGHLTPLGGGEYLFITTRGTFEEVTGGYKSLPLAKEIENRYSLTVSVGVGLGVSAYEAGTNARLALRHCIDGGGNMCFIVREDQSVIGPLELAEPLSVNLSLLDAALLARAEQAGLVSGYLIKLVNCITRIGKLDYTARELASILHVTVRTTHRLLVVWVDAGLVESTGMEKSGARGRPTQIYRLTCLSNLSRS